MLSPAMKANFKSQALRLRAEAATLCAKADIAENEDPAENYEKAAELFRMHAEQEMTVMRLALKEAGMR